jgi:hypothetical protein
MLIMAEEKCLNSSVTRAFLESLYLLQKKTPWPEFASELYRPGDRSLWAKLVPTFADRGCHVVSATDPYSRILNFLDQLFITINSKSIYFSQFKKRSATHET